MNQKKVLFFDIDGTLLTPHKRIVEQETIDILKELSKMDNIDMYISTGRSRQTIKEIEHIIPYFKGLNLANGGNIIIDDQEYFFLMEEELVRKLVKFLNKNKISYGVLTKNNNLRMYFSKEIKDAFDKAVDASYILLKEDDDFFFNEVVQFWVLGNNTELDLVKNNFDDLTVFYWGNFGSDVIPKGRDKASGIKEIMKIMEYDYKNTFAFGDSDNDVPMFKVVNTSITMGKSTIDAVKNATYQTDLIENAGLAKAIRKYVLENKK